MTPLLGQLGSRLLDRWTTLIALPGVLFAAVGILGVILGQQHALDVAMLSDRAEQEHWDTATDVVLLVALFGLAATGAGLAAQILGAGQLLWWLGSWPNPLRSWSDRRTDARRERWTRAQTEFTKALDEGDSRAAEAGARRNALALAEPSRPTWIGDRVAAVETRVRNAYGLDLPTVWPRLWLILPDHPRTEIQTARTRIDDAAVLAAWGLMYLLLGVFWWPAGLIGAVTWTVGWLTARQAVGGYAELVESAVDLYGGSLATGLGIELSGALTLDAGRAITRRVRKGA